MATQTTYLDNIPQAVRGAPATMLNGPLISRTVETAPIGFGLCVSQGTADKGCKAFGSGDTAASILGITLLDRSAAGLTVSGGQVTGSTVDSFGVGDSARIAAVGSGRDVWVTATVAVVAGNPVFVRPSNNTFQPTNANSAIQIPGARFDTSADAGALAVVRLA